MKRIILFFLTCIFYNYVSFGQTKKEVILSFEEKDFMFQKNGEQTSIIAKKGDAVVFGDSCNPALPFYQCMILISPHDSYLSHDAECKEILLASNVTVAPNKKPQPSNLSQVVQPMMDVLYNESDFPNTQVEYTGTHLMDGYKILSFVVSPFHFDNANHKLYLNQEIKISIEIGSNKSKSNYVQISGGNNMRETVTSLIENKEDIDKLYKINANNYVKNTNQANPYRYIIVTCDSLKATFENLAKWKTIKGVRTKVVTVEDCYQEFPNDSHQLAIKKVLSYYYSNGMEYTLLGGDVNIVPAQMCYLPNIDNTIDTPADLFYACLDSDISWDSNQDSIFAGPHDEVDISPEFIISRVSVESSEDATVFVNRIIEYESNPNVENWNNKILMCGYYRHCYKEKNGSMISDSQYDSEEIYENYIHPYWSGGKFELFDTWADYPYTGCAASRELIQTELEKGYIFVDEQSHGFVNRWGWLANDSCYTNVLASNLVNNYYTLITTISCHSNAFDKKSSDFPNEDFYYNTSLSEAFMRNPNSGVLGYWGSSREGWSGYTNKYVSEFYKSLLTGNSKQFCRATASAKSHFLSYANRTSSYYRRLMLSMNVLGDAEMPVYTDVPMELSFVNVRFTGGTLNVSTGENNCTVCISSADDNGDAFYYLASNTDSISLNDLNNDYYLCITKPGYIPYVARVGSLVILQNETQENNTHVFSDITQIGRNLISSRPSGEVVIEKDRIENYSNNHLQVKNSFRVKKGAQFLVRKNNNVE